MFRALGLRPVYSHIMPNINHYIYSLTHFCTKPGLREQRCVTVSRDGEDLVKSTLSFHNMVLYTRLVPCPNLCSSDSQALKHWTSSDLCPKMLS